MKYIKSLLLIVYISFNILIYIYNLLYNFNLTIISFVRNIIETFLINADIIITIKLIRVKTFKFIVFYLKAN